jgi:uncharacterized membrane protein YphA (DoxX/SURF4 family)
MLRIAALALWVVLMAAMWLFMAWGQQFKRQFQGQGVEVTQLQVSAIVLADILVNYWYVAAVVSLFACLAVSSGKPAEPQRGD